MNAPTPTKTPTRTKTTPTPTPTAAEVDRLLEQRHQFEQRQAEIIEETQELTEQLDDLAFNHLSGRNSEALASAETRIADLRVDAGRVAGSIRAVDSRLERARVRLSEEEREAAAAHAVQLAGEFDELRASLPARFYEAIKAVQRCAALETQVMQSGMIGGLNYHPTRWQLAISDILRVDLDGALPALGLCTGRGEVMRERALLQLRQSWTPWVPPMKEETNDE